MLVWVIVILLINFMFCYGCVKVFGGYILVYVVNLICVIVLFVKFVNIVSGKVFRVWGW